jgi:hypothetical protein
MMTFSREVRYLLGSTDVEVPEEVDVVLDRQYMQIDDLTTKSKWHQVYFLAVSLFFEER